MENNFHLVKFKSDKVKLGQGLIALGLANYAFKDVPFSTGIAIFDPGVSIPLHSHNSDEQITILSGNGIAEIEGKVFPVEKFDTTYIQIPCNSTITLIAQGSLGSIYEWYDSFRKKSMGISKT